MQKCVYVGAIEGLLSDSGCAYNQINKVEPMKSLHLILSVLAIATVSFTAFKQLDSAWPAADTIYYGGKIITIDPKYPNPRYVAVKDGKIQEIGYDARFHRLIGRNTTLVDIKDRALIPGFIDAHSHFSLTAIYLNLGFDISPPPFGNVTSISQILANIQEYITSKNIPAGTKIYGYGYNDQAVVEHRHPTKYELDSVSTVHPIVLRHYTGHLVAANSYALNAVGYTDSAQPPAGGVLDRYPNGTLTGVARQYAIVPLLAKFSVNFNELTYEQIQQTANLYYSCGVTTGHDTLTSLIQPTVYSSYGEKFPIELNTYFWVSSASLANFNNVVANLSTSKVKVRGAKFIIDGSINAYTALLTQPYWVPFANQYDDLSNYTYNTSRSCLTETCGQNGFPYPALLNNFFTTLHNANYDVLAHCNGDAAIDYFLNTVKYVRNNSNVTSDTRFVIIHAQTSRQDQLDIMKEFGATPSFFAPQIYYWGDIHYKITLGPERANRLSPSKSAVKRNLLYTLHNDSPVVVAGKYNGRNTFMEILDAAVNRDTSSGRILGEDQRLTVEQALAGLTINSAWQSREQDIKGSITPGKVADLVLLSDNPLECKGKRIKDITISATVKGGNLVYGKY